MSSEKHEVEEIKTTFKKISSALFYGIVSFTITLVNKTVLTTYKFPSFLVLSIGQLVATVVLLFVAKQLKYVSFPDFDANIPRKIFPLPLVYLANMVFGLGATQAVNLPMFTALRRFAELTTMYFEIIFLGTTLSIAMQLSVYLQIGGAIIAAFDDLTFNLMGYTYATVSNIATAANFVYIKQKLDVSNLGKYGLLFYNSIIVVIPVIIGTWAIGDFEKTRKFEYWNDFYFLIQFLLSCVMGFILMYSMVICTHYNSALTTAVVGGSKNVTITYIGMFVGGDYIFSWINWMGLNISVLGCVMYIYLMAKKQKNNVQVKEEEEKLVPKQNGDV